jgi:hypothetical protein
MTEEDGGGESFVCLLFYFLITQQNECMQIERWCGWLRLYNAVVTIFQTVDNYLRNFFSVSFQFSNVFQILIDWSFDRWRIVYMYLNVPSVVLIVGDCVCV